jgi:hypothetical protein
METGKCCDCGAETSLFVNGVAICVVCDAKREAMVAFPIPMRPRDGGKPVAAPEGGPPKARFAAA